jgi:hypothetical protein
MGAYTDFPKSFIERTVCNVNNYKGDYEVTNLINNCMGLLVILSNPRLIALPDYTFDDTNCRFSITKSNIQYEVSNDYSLRNVVRHIRNGLAHGRTEQQSDGNEIVGIRIHDKVNDTSGENFAIQLSIDEFRDFVLSLSKYYLQV